jgi:uncharacterized membrane protein YccC
MSSWVRARDPGLLIVKRSVRAAIVMPLTFAVAHLAFSDPQVSLFAAFGSFALLLLVEFPGRPRVRLVSYLSLFAVGTVFFVLGTLVSTNEIAAVCAMGLVAFVVLFLGIVSPQVASGSTAVLLTFVLPVSVAGNASAIGPRLLGWAIAGALCVPACLLIWPAPWHDDLRRHLSATMAALARLVRALADGQESSESSDAVVGALDGLRTQFNKTTYPPTGAVRGAVALTKLVGRLQWAASNTNLVSGDVPAGGERTTSPRALLEATAETLASCADLICDGKAHPVEDPAVVQVVQESTKRLNELIDVDRETELTTLLDEPAGTPAPPEPKTGSGSGVRDTAEITSRIDPTFHARILGMATLMIADGTLEAAGAVPVVDLPSHIASIGGTRKVLAGRLRSHLSFRSVWFRNSLRGAAGLALAVAVVEVTNVEHGFWVVLGALSVLRSNAFGTGSTALRAVTGTAVGFVVGSVIMLGIGSHLVLLWVFLPIAVLVSGAAPLTASFAVGQAGFTVVVIILFNIIEPLGWKVGLTRIEDVTIGCLVSVAVGLLFWPRGATAALGRALSESFVCNSTYLSAAVDWLTTTDSETDTTTLHQAADRAYLRLDDAYRQYLTERGAKIVPVETVSTLFTGANRIRLAAFTLASLPSISADPHHAELRTVETARQGVRVAFEENSGWYGQLSSLLTGAAEQLDPLPVHEARLSEVVSVAFDNARTERRDDELRIALRLAWAEELLEAQRLMQVDVARSAALLGAHS